jgi:chemotaxis protein methyltransferase CheR
MLDQENFNRLITYIENETGISLPESNYTEVIKLVEGIMQENNLTLTSYLDCVSKDKLFHDELMVGVTINETYFFREEKQFIHLKNHILPGLNYEKDCINIWSASCSSGEEPLSLLTLAKSIIPQQDRIKVYASDISQERLDLFSRGFFRPNSFRTDGSSFSELIKTFMTPVEGGIWKVDPTLINEIDRFKANLYLPPPERLPHMDIILLRNTLIYMNEKNKRIILDNVVKKLKPGGILFLASPEFPLVSHPALSIMERDGVYFFKKKDPLTLTPDALSSKIESAVQRGKSKSPSSVVKTVHNSLLKTPGREEGSFEDRVCRVITMDLNNEIYKREEETVERAAAYIKEILDSINRGDMKIEEEKLQEGEDHIITRNIPGLFSYYKAFNQYRRNNRESAELLFKKALESNNSLWPARFHLANLLPSGHKEKRRQLDVLVREIKMYIEGKRYDYQFMLEGFNACYFLMICEKNLSLEKENIPYVHR